MLEVTSDWDQKDDLKDREVARFVTLTQRRRSDVDRADVSFSDAFKSRVAVARARKGLS